MKEKLEAIKAEALSKIENAHELTLLNDVKVAVLGKKGELTQVLKGMKDVAPEDRPKVGQFVNEARAAIESALEAKSKEINRELRTEKMKRETIDVTLPGVKKVIGHRHPNQIALEDLERVFIGMGYEIVEGPEVEYDKYNYYGAECLYLGIVHDTGVFKHSNTTKHAMTVAGDLIEKGARPYYVIDETFYKKTFAQNKLLGVALGNAIQYADGKITLSVLSKEDFKKTGTTKADTDGIVDQLRITEGTETAVFMYQLDDGYKVSLRSNRIVDVSRIAVSHGGGGHIRAAGFSMMGDIREIVSLIVSEICMQLGV